MKDEQWRDVKEYEGIYQVSNKGRVKALARNIPQKHIKNRWFEEKILSSADGGYKLKYLIVNLQGKINLVHRLVAQAFIDNPDNFETVNHKDGNQKNNSVENLEWLSGKANTRHYWNNNKNRRGVSLFRNGKQPNVKYRMRMRILTGLKPFTLTEYFKTKEEAYQCYFDTYKEWHGISPW